MDKNSEMESKAMTWENQVLYAALEHFGEARQVDKMMEEMAELQDALLDERWRPETEDERAIYVAAVQDEIADVGIVLDQMKILFGKETCAARRMYKLARLDKKVRQE